MTAARAAGGTTAPGGTATGTTPPAGPAAAGTAPRGSAATAPAPPAMPPAAPPAPADPSSLARRATADPLFRLVAYALEAAHGRAPTAVWSAPHAFHLGSPGLVAAAGWPVAAAAAPRTDGTVRLSSLGHPAQSCALALTGAPGAEVPDWARRPYAVLRALAAAGHGRGGTDLHVHGTLTAAAGLSLTEPADCAVALAALDAHAPGAGPVPRATVARILAAVAPRDDRALREAVLWARPGTALLHTDGGRRHVPFDPAGSGTRLVLMAVRGEPADRGPDLARAVESARRAGAVSVWPPGDGPPGSVLLLLPAPRRSAVRAAVAQEFRSRCRPVPRFLNIAVTGAARRED
ncbi:galactokinase [Streptomyces sp. NPDC089919]|uniref:galactokinase n=1 Tax=Streptomyces sp. NPDC089919 TaxID=3155188 RepID=UPI0034207055